MPSWWAAGFAVAFRSPRLSAKTTMLGALATSSPSRKLRDDDRPLAGRRRVAGIASTVRRPRALRPRVQGEPLKLRGPSGSVRPAPERNGRRIGSDLRHDQLGGVAIARADRRQCPRRAANSSLVDVLVFGETGLVAHRRGADGKPAPIAIRPSRAAARRRRKASTCSTSRARRPARSRSPARWCRTPPSRPARSAAAAPRLKITEGSIDTGYACRVDRDTKMITIDGPPAGIVSVGGYRFALRAAQDLVAGIEDGSTLAALPDLRRRTSPGGRGRRPRCDLRRAAGARRQPACWLRHSAPEFRHSRHRPLNPLRKIRQGPLTRPLRGPGRLPACRA